MAHVLERKITLTIFLFFLQIKTTNEVTNVKTKQNKTKPSMTSTSVTLILGREEDWESKACILGYIVTGKPGLHKLLTFRENKETNKNDTVASPKPI